MTNDFGAPGGAGAGSVAIQPDRKIIAAGGSFGERVTEFALARYDTDGSLDTSFGGDGMVTTAFGGSGSFAFIADVAIQPDKKIVAAGGTGVSTPYDPALVRYNSDATLDDGLIPLYQPIPVWLRCVRA